MALNAFPSSLQEAILQDLYLGMNLYNEVILLADVVRTMEDA